MRNGFDYKIVFTNFTVYLFSSLGRISLAEFKKHVVAHIPNRWRDFGISLGLTITAIDTYAAQHQSAHEPIFAAIYDYWRGSSLRFPCTWNGVVQLLRTRTIDEIDLADEIEKHSLKLVSLADFTEHVVTNIPNLWQKFGISLGISSALIDAYAIRHQSAHRAIFGDIYDYWRENESSLGYSLTWEGIVQLLRTRAIDQVVLAGKIEDQFCS